MRDLKRHPLQPTGYSMLVTFSGHDVRCETTGKLICLNDLVQAGNAWRINNGKRIVTIQQVVHQSAAFEEFADAASRVYELPREEMVKVVGRGNQARTMAHVALAIFIAEQMSPEFHVNVIKTFLEGKLLEFREMGGTEFKNLNAAIDLYLPGRDGKDNKGVYIQIAMRLRARLLGPEAGSEAWATANVGQTHARYSAEAYLVRALGDGLVRDYEHLKELVTKI